MTITDRTAARSSVPRKTAAPHAALEAVDGWINDVDRSSILALRTRGVNGAAEAGVVTPVASRGCLPLVERAAADHRSPTPAVPLHRHPSRGESGRRTAEPHPREPVA